MNNEIRKLNDDIIRLFSIDSALMLNVSYDLKKIVILLHEILDTQTNYDHVSANQVNKDIEKLEEKQLKQSKELEEICLMM